MNKSSPKIEEQDLTKRPHYSSAESLDNEDKVSYNSDVNGYNSAEELSSRNLYLYITIELF